MKNRNWGKVYEKQQEICPSHYLNVCNNWKCHKIQFGWWRILFTFLYVLFNLFTPIRQIKASSSRKKRKYTDPNNALGNGLKWAVSKRWNHFHENLVTDFAINSLLLLHDPSVKHERSLPGKVLSRGPIPLLCDVTTATTSYWGNTKMNCPPAPRHVMHLVSVLSTMASCCQKKKPYEFVSEGAHNGLVARSINSAGTICLPLSRPL